MREIFASWGFPDGKKKFLQAGSPQCGCGPILMQHANEREGKSLASHAWLRSAGHRQAPVKIPKLEKLFQPFQNTARLPMLGCGGSLLWWVGEGRTTHQRGWGWVGVDHPLPPICFGDSFGRANGGEQPFLGGKDPVGALGHRGRGTAWSGRGRAPSGAAGPPRCAAPTAGSSPPPRTAPSGPSSAPAAAACPPSAAPSPRRHFICIWGGVLVQQACHVLWLVHGLPSG